MFTAYKDQYLLVCGQSNGFFLIFQLGLGVMIVVHVVFVLMLLMIGSCFFVTSQVLSVYNCLLVDNFFMDNDHFQHVTA